MPRPIFAAMLAASLALTPVTATTARAQSNEQLAQVLAGAATLAILGLAWKHDQKHDRKARAQAVTPHQPRYDKVHSGKRRHDDRFYRNDRHDRKRDHGYRKQSRKVVPSRCLRSIETNRGTRNFFAAPCLRRSMHNVANLPRQCARVFNGYRGPVTGYTPRCLHRFGWRRG